MSDILRPIHDRTQRPILSDSEAMSIEWLRVSYQQVILEREERIAAELAGLRRDNAALAEQNDALTAENARLRGADTAMGQTIETLGTRAFRERERRIRSEQFTTVVLTIALVATGVAVWLAWTAWR